LILVGYEDERRIIAQYFGDTIPLDEANEAFVVESNLYAGRLALPLNADARHVVIP